MTPNDHRKLRKINVALGIFRDKYVKEGNTVIASKFARAMALIVEILQEEKIDGKHDESGS